MDIIQLEEELNKIKERNRRVEREKAWEISWTRKIMVAVLTYIVVAVFFFYLRTPDPMETAIVPTIAFLLSTMSAPFIKKLWLRYIHEK
ncbi:MAG: hypothetical protein ACD_38C00019G0002 [uncultured bacterium]|uniref:Uncharacterized protein n=1 Tax=Candidatus Daviesbacteria bacterium GW2011_GWC2_40_12 TaxID=1618431 RepID=A0A0G0QQ55_9BACT|nr:MAG: hypothetical protein ACD_38C00019G0002 [uncultured bacterium]KKR15842.1 MAG: hypothetical protein UT45_C0012G0002 [Candidatus Daviesbacteria bacterium GW2011_GWA2_39_33]KKR23633.1 MAG: hypothetical protein UT54_C0042G0002 [Candidatus Daviesbacteria bacterium GW2011_GWB1_39_5]KKR42569.1 MAG: hypothetical protein UT77_C0001G0020 [Candidatus Daviesbacteria bacterium GW2011_GWC2_40_12]OGE21827.1 MAG: hypothetical protein A2778_02910 [Candidatus Daviesbacteria bacterium RIFCSPHIGHO2_01_FULL_